MHNGTSNYSSRDEDHCSRYQLSPIGEHSNKHFPVNYHGFLFTVIIVNSLSFPFTIFLNAMVLMAVIRKPRLQTNPNILLACLSVTDLLVGMISQPLHVSIALLLLLGNRSHKFCHITLVFNASVQILRGASLFHLVLISAERYFTIKHSFANGILITKARLIISSVVAWIATLILVIVPTATRKTVILILRQIAAISLIVAFQVIVYREVRQHEEQILALQVSLEERLKFQKEKRALKLTSTIIAAVAVSYTTPWIITVIAWLLFAKETIDVLMAVREVGLLPLLLNSVINPIIYTVKIIRFELPSSSCCQEKVFKRLKLSMDGCLDQRLSVLSKPQEGRRQMKAINWNTILITTTTIVYVKCIDNIQKLAFTLSPMR